MALKQLIEALQIIDKYSDGLNGQTHCEHDVMCVVGVDPEKVTAEDLARLDELGFQPRDEFNNGEVYFTSYRWGSA